MNLDCPICATESRNVDGFDLIAVLGLMKEYNWQEIWKRYRPEDSSNDSISMYVKADRYFVELHIQQMQRIILSEKFNTNPFFMQQIIQRMTASHDHDLIMSKIRQQGLDTGDSPISLSCSMGNTIIDLIAHRNEPFFEIAERTHGATHIEVVEQRPLDVHDLSSILYLCQQNLTEAIFRRYYDSQAGRDNDSGQGAVKMRVKVGHYEVNLSFRFMPTNREIGIRPPGNASVFTIHQVIQRMNFRHAPELILKEMQDVGLSVTLEQVQREFSLSRFINNTALTFNFNKA
ncbi:MAG: hypothetical protein HY913_15775 [Desulfomonile tiedjei]|nr:hypothetical protein [Desulfomonile tiedjei]